MTYDVLLTRKANKFIARVRQWPVIVVEGESEEEVLRQAQADLQALLAGGRIIQLELDESEEPHSKWVGSGRVALRYVSPIPPLEPGMRLLPRTAHEIGTLW